MQVILSSISAGGLSGVADQYLCLLILAAAARLGIVKLAVPMQFMSEWWFIILVALLWLLTLAPAYSSLFAPGVMNAINAVVRFVSGFLVPLSSALLALAYAGVLVNLDPELRHMLETMQIFNSSGGIGAGGIFVAGSSAIVATSLTGMKALAKPAISATTHTTGAAAAPIYATIENIAAVIVMAAVYFLSKVDPWLLVVLMAIVFLATVALMAYVLYQLWRLKRGLARVSYMAQVRPRAGLAVIAEFFIWGAGWLIWGIWGRGVIMLAAWLGWIALFAGALMLTGALLAFFPPLIPLATVFCISVMMMIFLRVGFETASALMKMLDKEVPLADVAPAQTAAH